MSKPTWNIISTEVEEEENGDEIEIILNKIKTLQESPLYMNDEESLDEVQKRRDDNMAQLNKEYNTIVHRKKMKKIFLSLQ